MKMSKDLNFISANKGEIKITSPQMKIYMQGINGLRTKKLLEKRCIY